MLDTVTAMYDGGREGALDKTRRRADSSLSVLYQYIAFTTAS